MQIFNKLLMQSVAINGAFNDSLVPVYTFPQTQQKELHESLSVGAIATIVVFCIIVLLSILGFFVEYRSLGNKKNSKTMVEAYEYEQPNKVSLEAKKQKWALFVYSFSITKNFNEIFFKDYQTIKDRNFEVFNGLKVLMLCWTILGHVYVIGYQYGNANTQLYTTVVTNFFTQFVISSDFAISFFYFASAFIGLFGLLKKY